MYFICRIQYPKYIRLKIQKITHFQNVFFNVVNAVCMKILIAEVIYKKNLSLRQVSILTGVPKSTLGKLCNGSVPRLDTLEQIAKGLQVHMQDLYDSPWK